jgi:hypothetical protein
MVHMGLLAEQTIGKQEIGRSEEFSLVLGGPLYRLLLRSKLVQPPLGHLGWRIGVITSLAWLPLIALTVVGGRFVDGVKVPFLYDFEVHARLLFALPLLVFAELIVYIRMRAIVPQFIERRIITDDIRSNFNAIISSAIGLRDSLLAEITLLLLVILVGSHVWRLSLALQSDTWYGTVSSSTLNYTAAGYWYAFVSVPVFQFILLRWYYRIIIWCRFLFQVSRLDLNLIALHPDRCCGLGFLGNVVSSFAPLLMAHSGIVAGYIANRILHEGATLPDYRFDLLSMAALLLAIVLGPLCVFIPKLNRARLAGLRTYGGLASDYVVGFAEKWTRDANGVSTNPQNEPLLGSADIQSLADLANSFAIVKEVKLVPFGRDTAIRFLVVIAIPVAPLALTMFSPEELLKRLITVVL